MEFYHIKTDHFRLQQATDAGLHWWKSQEALGSGWAQCFDETPQTGTVAWWGKQSHSYSSIFISFFLSFSLILVYTPSKSILIFVSLLDFCVWFVNNVLNIPNNTKGSSNSLKITLIYQMTLEDKTRQDLFYSYYNIMTLICKGVFNYNKYCTGYLK